MADENNILDEAIKTTTKKLTDDGKLIEAGFTLFRRYVIPADAPAMQVEEMRKAFFAGAQHLFASIMTMLDPGEDPTEADLDRMDRISAELKAFAGELAKRLPTSVRSGARQPSH